MMNVIKQTALLVIIIISIFLLSACGNGTTKNDIVGEWKLTKEETIVNGEVENVSPGNGEKYLFNSDGSGEWIGNGYEKQEIEWTLSGDKLGYSISFMNPNFTVVKEGENDLILIQEGEDYSIKKYLTKI